MSQQLLWEVIKHNNSFLVKRNGLNFSTDPFNNTGRQTYGSCGLVQRNAVAIGPKKSLDQNKRPFTKISLGFKARRRFQHKSKDVKPHQASRKIDRSVVLVKSTIGIVADKIICKSFRHQSQGLKQSALRKLHWLKKAYTIKKIADKKK